MIRRQLVMNSQHRHIRSRKILLYLNIYQILITVQIYIYIYICIYIVTCISEYRRGFDWFIDLLTTYRSNYK
jgi:hypothetical protein